MEVADKSIKTTTQLFHGIPPASCKHECIHQVMVDVLTTEESRSRLYLSSMGSFWIF